VPAVAVLERHIRPMPAILRRHARSTGEANEKTIHSRRTTRDGSGARTSSARRQKGAAVAYWTHPRIHRCLGVIAKCNSFCDTLVLGAVCSYKDLGIHRGLVSR
jgi:hypothetical protein